MAVEAGEGKGSVGTGLGVFLCSFATVYMELLHTRLLSFSLWHSVVYAAITVAMLGFGVGGALLASFPRLRGGDVGSKLALFSLGFALSAVAGFALVSCFPIDSFRMSKVMFAELSIVFLLLMLPYCFAGAVVTLAIMSSRERTHRLYFANMVGSGMGSLLFVFTIGPLGGERCLFFAALLGIAAAVAFVLRGSRVLLAVSVALGVVVCVLGVVAPTRVVDLKFEPNKAVAEWTDPVKYPDAVVEFTEWSPISRVDVIGSAAGMVEELPDGTLMPFKVITTDGDATTIMLSGPDERELEEWKGRPGYYRNFRTLAYEVLDEPNVLLIGVGGGTDALMAVLNSARRVTAVDINPTTLRLGSEVYADFNHGLFQREEITPVVAEGRSFIRRASEDYDLIHLHGVDTFAALSSGAYVLAEHYLYTEEAFADYFERLSSTGILSITRYAFDYPRESLKLFGTAVTALRKMGADPVGGHLYAIKAPDSPWATLLCKKTPFTAGDRARYDALFAEVPYRVMYEPGMEADVAGFPSGPDAYYVKLVQAASEGGLDRFWRDYKYDILPTTDNRPFFFKYYKWSLLGSLMSDTTGWAGAEGPLGLFILASLIVSAFVSTVVLIFAPLWKFNRDGLGVPNVARYTLFFLCLGLGFMFLEIGFMQKFALFLGHPTYSIAVVLFAVLTFSGLGSLVAGRLRVSYSKIIAASVAGISVIVVLDTLLLHHLFNALLGYPISVRVLASVVVIAPLALCLGMPFPTGLRAMHEIHPASVAWVSGINGAASVFGSILAIVLAMAGGFSSVFLVSVGIYILGALLVCPILPPRSGMESAR